MQMFRRSFGRTGLIFALAIALGALPAQARRRAVRKLSNSVEIKPDAACTGNNPDATCIEPIQPMLQYCGGRILSNAKVVAVLWGTPGALASTPSCPTGTFQQCLDAYYSRLVQDPQLGWLDEYNTATAGGTNQHITGVTYSGSFVITPSTTAGKKSVVSESAVETEIDTQIAAGHLPAEDANDETIYEVHFPLTVDPSDSENGQACSDFCAYHDTYQSNITGTTNIIAIIPSGEPPGYSGGRSCATGCGERSDWFANLSGSLSHETFESVTDPDIGLDEDANFTCVAPVGWYDFNTNDGDAMSAHGEVADMCEGLTDVNYLNQITELTYEATRRRRLRGAAPLVEPVLGVPRRQGQRVLDLRPERHHRGARRSLDADDDRDHADLGRRLAPRHLRDALATVTTGVTATSIRRR